MLLHQFVNEILSKLTLACSSSINSLKWLQTTIKKLSKFKIIQ